ASARAAEEHVEEIAESATEGIAAGRDSVRTIRVVAPTLLWVTEGLVGQAHLLEPRFGGGITRVGIRVQLTSPFAVSPFELLLGRVARHTEQCVVVLSHARQPSLKCRPRRLLTTATAASAC